MAAELVFLRIGSREWGRWVSGRERLRGCAAGSGLSELLADWSWLKGEEWAPAASARPVWRCWPSGS